MSKLGVLVLGLVGVSACAHQASSLPSRLEVGQPLAFELPGIHGQSVRLSDYRGSVVLVDIWATWCVPCEESFPFYKKLYHSRREQGFEIIAVSVDERLDDVKKWVVGRALPFVVAHDPESTLPERIGLRTMPSAVLVDRQGNVVALHAGFEQPQISHIQEIVDRALGLAVPGEEGYMYHDQ
ncbi:MAG: TlpA family protein disulfide reductase [Myxococcales bacterium]|nr:TlpA family protein disulfide reductase [Myxococcales bacterium]